MNLIVFTKPCAGREVEYNDWYNNIHLRDIRAVPGVKRVTRFRRHEFGPQTSLHEYMAVCEIDGDLETVMAEIATRAGTELMLMSDAIDVEETILGAYEAM